MKSTNNIIAKVQGKFADLVKPVSGAGGPEITPSGSYVRGADVSEEGSDCGCGGSSKAGGSKGGSKSPAKDYNKGYAKPGSKK